VRARYQVQTVAERLLTLLAELVGAREERP
jgi:hypothetical protein